MTKSVCGTLVSILLLSFSSQIAASFDLTDALVTPTCTALVGAISTGTCAQDFEESVRPFRSSDGSLPAPVACCALTTLRYCVLGNIEASCGSSASGTVDLALKGIVGAAKAASGETVPCDGNEFYYRKESPICWPVWGHAVGGILLFVLLITIVCTCCCVCCKKFCCRSAKKQPIVLNLLPTHNPLSNSPPYSRLEK